MDYQLINSKLLDMLQYESATLEEYRRAIVGIWFSPNKMGTLGIAHEDALLLVQFFSSYPGFFRVFVANIFTLLAVNTQFCANNQQLVDQAIDFLNCKIRRRNHDARRENPLVQTYSGRPVVWARYKHQADTVQYKGGQQVTVSSLGKRTAETAGLSDSERAKMYRKIN